MFETLRLLHRNANGQERERLVSLSGEPREILRQDDHSPCLLPKQRQLDADRPGFAGCSAHVRRKKCAKS